MLLLLLRGTQTLVGSSGLHRLDWEAPKFEIGYWCRNRSTVQGYVTEAVRGISAFAFDTLGARRLEIQCDSRNLPSARVAERAGFRLESELRNNELDTSGILRNTLVYAMMPEEHEGTERLLTPGNRLAGSAAGQPPARSLTYASYEGWVARGRRRERRARMAAPVPSKDRA